MAPGSPPCDWGVGGDRAIVRWGTQEHERVGEDAEYQGLGGGSQELDVEDTCLQVQTGEAVQDSVWMTTDRRAKVDGALGTGQASGRTKDRRGGGNGRTEARGGEGRPGRGEPRGHGPERCGAQGCSPGGCAHLVESHLEDGLRRAALLLGAQVVAQLLGHFLHHVVPQLHIAHLCPRVLVILDELGEVESQALAEFVEDPEGAGKAGEGAAAGIGVPSPPRA